MVDESQKCCGFIIGQPHLPKKAVGEMIPVLFATRMAVPDSRKGAVKSTAASRSALTFDHFQTIYVDNSKKLDPFI